MRILYHHRIASKDGQYVHVEELTNALLEAGHHLTIVAPKFSKKSEFGDDGGVSATLKNALPRALYEILELAYSFVVATRLTVALLRKRPDFIYERYNLYQPAGVIVARLFRIPILLEVNAPLAQERRRYSGLSLGWLAKSIEAFTWRTADIVLPVSAVLGEIIKDSGANEERIHVIHNGINVNLLEQEFAKKDQFLKNSKVVIGFVGFINPWHRLDLAIDAIVRHKAKNIQFVCIGDGDIKDELTAQARRLGVEEKVTFTGLVSRDEVFEHIRQFDIALQPSVTPYASPLKLFEYLAASCLVIAPRSDNIREIVSEETALLFAHDDFDDFSRKLTEAIENIDGFDDRRMMARQSILENGFTWQANANRVVDIASGLLEQASP